jgi:hypothetical protein
MHVIKVDKIKILINGGEEIEVTIWYSFKEL